MRFRRLRYGMIASVAWLAACADVRPPFAKVDAGTGKGDSPSDLSGFGFSTDAAAGTDGAVSTAQSGCVVSGIAGVMDPSSGKCIYKLCATSAECTTKASPMSGIGSRPIDGRFPVTATITNVSLVTATYQAISTPNATNLCARYASEYWAHVRRADVPSCGWNYGLAKASNTSGGFEGQDYPLCSLAYANVPGNPTGLPDSSFAVTGIPIIDAVWCKKVPDSTSSSSTVTPPAFNSFNALPFDTDPHDNNDPRYQYPPPDPGGTGGA